MKVVNRILDCFFIFVSSGDRIVIINNIYPFAPLYRKWEPKIQMRLQVGGCPEISETNLFCPGDVFLLGT